MYKDRKRVRENHVRIYLSDYEQAEIDQASVDAGRERAAFIRDAALVVARYVRGCRPTRGDLLVQVQLRLAQQEAANDDPSMFSLAS